MSDDPPTTTPALNGGRYPYHPRSVRFETLSGRLPARLELFEEPSVIVLPTRNGTPHPSKEANGHGFTLRPWQVPTGMSIADCVVDCLLRGDLDLEPESELSFSDTLGFWEAVADFAQTLVDLRQFVPAVAPVEGKHYPLWQAAFTHESEAHWDKLKACMPAICRAAVPPTSATNNTPPADPAMNFLDACIDHIVRQKRLRKFGKLSARRPASTPPHRQWLNAVRCGQFAAIDGTAVELTRFANEVAAWSELLRPAAPRHPLRLALELQPPGREDGPWSLHFGLRSLKNPALRLPAEQIWGINGDQGVDHHFPGAREALLAGLGVAKELFPPLASGLQTITPVSCDISRDEATEFMTVTTALLRRLGLAVDLPDWWEDKGAESGVQLRMLAKTSATPDREALLGVNQLMDFRWEMALGDQVLSETEFMDLTKDKQPLVFHRGKWIRMDVKALRQTLKFLKEHGDSGQATLAEALAMSNDLRQSGGLAVSDFILDSESGEAFSTLEPGRDFTELPTPKGFKGELRPYQTKGYSWMVFAKDLKFGACLADDMGLGKTIQMIAALLHDLEADERIGRPTLIIAPMSVVGNWVKEFQRFAPSVRVMVHHGQDRCERKQFLEQLDVSDVVISTYNLVVRDKSIFQSVNWWSIALDEAQNIKNPSTKQASAIRSLRSHSRFCLTGTPVENRLTELWSLMDFLNPGYLGPLSFFRNYFSMPIERDSDDGRAALLQRMIRPFILRRLKSDRNIIRDLPDKQENKVYCTLTSEQAALYQLVVGEMLKRINDTEGVERKGLVLGTLTKLKQITNHPRHFLRDDSKFSSERSGKLQRLEEMIETVLAEGEKALIFSQFTELGDQLRKKLETSFDVEVLYMHGGTPKARRDEMVARFQRKGGPPLFLLSLKAGGLGLNLTAATHVFHFDRWWNPAVEDQATDRAYRIGQTRNVQVHKFISIGTVEEKIDQMIEEKKNLASQIVTVGESMLTELSTDQLRELFALTADAVVE